MYRVKSNVNYRGSEYEKLCGVCMRVVASGGDCYVVGRVVRFVGVCVFLVCV